MTQIKTPKAAFVGVDWGTSNFRAWLMSKTGEVLAETKSSEGMLHCTSSGFSPVLAAHLQKLDAPDGLPVLICGMAGARQGWVEAPYLNTPTPLDNLHLGAVLAPFQSTAYILPGVAQADPSRPDVMRGEETQLLGAISPNFTGLVCIPGTHSKWVRVEDGILHAFTTYMTGELFSVLSSHSILKHAVEDITGDTTDTEAFITGLEAAIRRPDALTTQLFGLRASQLLGFSGREDGASSLSGLLIGAELAEALKHSRKDEPIIIIGSGRLASLYATAMQHEDYNPVIMDAEDASRNGLLKAAHHLWNMETK